MSDTELLVVRDAAVHETDIVRAWLAADGDATGASEIRFMVLFDTCDQVIRGAAAVRRRCHCTFELVAWAVDAALTDAIAARLVNGVVDGVRRAGGRRVASPVASLDPVRLRVLLMVGFSLSNPDAVEAILDE